MNMEIAAWSMFIVNVVLAIFSYGVLFAKVNGHEKRHDATDRKLDAIGDEQDRQWKDIGMSQSAIARIEGRMNGKAHGHNA